MSKPQYLTLDDLEGKRDVWRKLQRYSFLGQMKLFTSTVTFLLKLNLDKNTIYTMLYIGSAPGSNLYFILKMLEDYKIYVHLFDPNPHDKRLLTLENVTIHSELFTEKQYHSWTNIDNLIFISDIRSINKNAREPSLSNLLYDYNIQFRCYDAIKPKYASFKLRYPFPTEIDKGFKMEIPFGVEYLQICTGDSNERRLILTNYNPKKTTIDYERCKDSEEMMAFYNNYKYKNRDYDACVFKYYIRKLFQKANIDLDLSTTTDINTLMYTISNGIRDFRVLELPFPKKIKQSDNKIRQ